jgi:hypothetical protein
MLTSNFFPCPKYSTDLNLWETIVLLVRNLMLFAMWTMLIVEWIPRPTRHGIVGVGIAARGRFRHDFRDLRLPWQLASTWGQQIEVGEIKHPHHNSPEDQKRFGVFQG